MIITLIVCIFLYSLVDRVLIHLERNDENKNET